MILGRGNLNKNILSEIITHPSVAIKKKGKPIDGQHQHLMAKDRYRHLQARTSKGKSESGKGKRKAGSLTVA